MDAYGYIFIAAYLMAGFVGGYFVVRDGRCESPASTWLFFTFAGPLLAAVLAVLILPFLPFGILCSMLNIGSSDYDSRGA